MQRQSVQLKCWDWRFLFLLIFSTGLDYYTGIKMKDASSDRLKKIWFWLSICINVGFLGVFKYYNFFAASFADFLSNFGFQVNVGTLEIILPVGYENYQDQVKNLKVPILLFAGSQDVFTTQADSKQIAKQRKNRSLTVFNGGHLQGFQTMTKGFFGDRYIAQIEKFISKLNS